MDRIDADIWTAKDVARLLALVENEKRYYQEILTHFPVAAAIVSRDLSLVSFNREFRRRFLPHQNEETQHRLTDVLHATVVRERIVPVFDASKSAHEAEITVVNESGVASPWLLDALPLPNVHSDSPEEALVVLRSVVETESGLSALLDSAGSVVWKLDPASGDLEFGNTAASRLLGFHNPAQWMKRVHSEDERRVAWVYEAVIESAHEATVEYRLVRPGPDDVAVLWAADQLLPQKNPAGKVGLLHVITSLQSERRKQFAESIQEREVAASMRLARQVAHEFNNLWMIVNGYAEVMESRFGHDEEARNSLDEIARAARRGIETTRQLLEFSRPPGVSTQPFDLHRELREWNLDADLALPPGPAPVAADPQRLQSAIRELIDFARQRHGGREPRVTIETRRETLLSDYGSGSLQGRYVVLQAGPVVGLKPSTIEHWCEPFFSEGEKSATLGLASVYTQLRQMGVTVQLSPTGPRSGVFQLYLPLAALPESARPKPAAPPVVPAQQPPVAAPTAETVLVVDADDSIRALMARILERQGYRVLAAANGEEALALAHDVVSASAGMPTLLVTDVAMEGMRGPELAVLIRESIPSLRVLYVSGFAEEPEFVAGELPSGEGFLQKPFTISSLTSMVRTVLDAPRD